MKNIFKTFIILLVSLIVVPFTVNAAAITYEDIPNGSYVIGKHIFTRDGGSLTVKKIMIASRTIESENMDDMQIIYKDIMGNLKEVSAGKDAYTNQYPDADVELTDVINYDHYDLKRIIVVNEPNLGNLVPIKYNGENWEYANTSEKWYDYENKEWANAVVLTEGVEKSIGDPILDSEIDLWFVWVPRYEYKLHADSNGAIGTPKAIDINFISSSETIPSEGYSFHPGFAWDSDWSDGISEWKDGIWIGKFESTADDVYLNSVQKIKIKPNIYAWTKAQLSNMYISGLNLGTDYGIRNLDSHMTRYTEWTAISYLTNSIYGRCTDSETCKEVYINNGGKIAEGDYKKNIGHSTTGNITGIYDLNGGENEYVMGYLSKTIGDSGFALLPTDNKYADIFTSNDTSAHTYSAITHINGITSMNGVFAELLSKKTLYNGWYSDRTFFVNSSNPWFVLGGGSTDDNFAGIFASYEEDGGLSIYNGFRVALS